MSDLARTITVRSAILLVVSSIVGSGVFKKVAPMAAELGSPTLIIICWVVAGLISLAGALTYAELAGMFPHSGGEYVYFRKVYGRLFAFLYGWGAFAVLRTATIAALAHIFGQSLISLTDLSGEAQHYAVLGAATLLVLFLTVINCRGVAVAEGLSRGLLYVTFLAIAVIAYWGFSSASGSWANLTHTVEPVNASGRTGLLGSLVVASLGAFWGYEGWNQIGFIGEEIKNPQKGLPMAFGIGTIIVISLYALLNVVYVYVVPVEELIRLAGEPGKIAAVEVVRQAAGWGGAMFVSCLILITTSNATNASVLMPARVFYAMAKDGLFFKSAAKVHPRYKTPVAAILIQSAWSIVLIWSGSFDQLTDMLVFAAFIFYGSAGVSVILLRRREPDRIRPYRVLAYPVIPLFFCAACLLIVVTTLINQPQESLAGLGLIATGLPFYWYWSKKKGG